MVMGLGSLMGFFLAFGALMLLGGLILYVYLALVYMTLAKKLKYDKP
ncbi:hypothetical protein HYX14_01830 [Candidatus Woesearchaeota archaeon]|nr:hypothetical protein [Candidatus Woesearchaeota archaeon]